MSELKALNANRGYVKGSLTRISKFCESDDVKTCAYEILQEKRNRLAAAFNEYEIQNQGILLLDPADKEDYGEYEDVYYKSVAILDYQIKMRRPEALVNKERTTSANTEKRAIAQENTGEEVHAASHSEKSSKAARAVSGVVTSKATCVAA